MANITNKELNEILFPEETIKFLESHPGCYQRAARMYGKESVSCTGKAALHNLGVIKESVTQSLEIVKRNSKFEIE